MKKPVILIIMDGLGLRDEAEDNAVTLASTPNLDVLQKEYPTTELTASGEAVGLPPGQMGNSEVGHLNLGAGRIVYQSLSRINKSIEDGDFFTNEAYVSACQTVKEKGTKLHIYGLLSDGGVHSHINHFKAILKLAKDQGVQQTYVHAFLDGRDTPPDSGVGYLEELQDTMNSLGYGQIGTVHGRYYAMDRDKNYDRTQKSYDVLTQGEGPTYPSAIDGVKANYSDGITDEFVVPFVVDKDSMITDGDAIICMNFRPDRAIQISAAMSNPDGLIYTEGKATLDSSKGPKDITYVSTMHYNENVKGSIAYPLQSLDDMYGDVISKNGMTQLRIAETEKYAHVTFFFDGGVDRNIEGADRILVNSPAVATYDLKPEMSAYEVTDKVLDAIAQNKYDTIILNYANCDMVGHTGSIPAAIKAVETVDECVGKVVDAILDKDGVALITADHGNADKMRDEKGDMFTAHTTNPVPFIVTKKGLELREDGVLADIIPTMLELLNLEQPSAMTGRSMIKK